MPHVTFVALSGIRVREEALAKLGMSLPGLQPRAAAITALPPLGLLTLAGLTPNDWSISLHETTCITNDLIQTITLESPTIVAISALTASILDAYRLADALRAEGIAVALGGLHVTACPDEASRHADTIVVGDGEPLWTQLLEDAETGNLRTQYHPTKPFDLAHAPLPRYDLLAQGSRPRFTLQTSRGCPFACDFCAASRLLGPFRRKPASRLREELNAIRLIDPKPMIELADDNTFAAGGPHRELLDVLADSGARWFTEADWRLGENPAVLEHLASSGCVQVLVGLESLVYQHMGMGAKKTSLARMMDAVEAIQTAGVAVIGCFIVGCDGETPDSIERLRAYLEDCPCADIQITLQTPFPATALRQRLLHEGRILCDRDWSAYTLFDVTYHPDAMTPAELQRAFESLIKASFGPEPTQRRKTILRNTWRNNQAITP